MFFTSLCFTLIAGVFLGFSTIGINVCKFTNDALVDPNYPKKLVSSVLEPFLDSCLYNKSEAGFLENSLPESHLKTFRMTIKPFISLANFDEANLGADSELRRFKNDVSSFELLGLAPASIPYYQSVFTQFNAKLNCIPNEIQPTQNQCTLSPSTQAGDLKSTRNTSDYCLTLNRADFTEITGRYDAATCMDGSPPLTTLVGSIEQAFASAKSSWDSGRALT